MRLRVADNMLAAGTFTFSEFPAVTIVPAVVIVSAVVVASAVVVVLAVVVMV